MQIAYGTGLDDASATTAYAARYGTAPTGRAGTDLATSASTTAMPSLQAPPGLAALPGLVAGPMAMAEVATAIVVATVYRRMRAVSRRPDGERASWLPDDGPEARRAFEARYGRGLA